MATPSDVIGGADGPTAIFVSRPAGQETLLLFAALLAALAVLIFVGKRMKKHRLLAPVGAALVFACDRAVKLLVTLTLDAGETAALLPGLFRLELAHNYGAAWSSFSGARRLLVIVTAVGLCALGYLALKIVRHPLGTWALWLVIGGGAGNLFDRVAYGYVADMFAAEFIRFPVFNVADIFITCGTIAAAVYYVKFYEKYDAVNWTSPERRSEGGARPDVPDSSDR